MTDHDPNQANWPAAETGLLQRRRLLAAANALLASSAVAVFGAHAQQSGKVWRVGVLRPGPDDTVFRQNFDLFRQALREARFVEGTNLAFEFRFRDGPAVEMPALADQLVRARVDAILAFSTAGVGAAAKASATVPIVAIDLESDPVALGFAANLARPGRNVTGLFLDFPELGGKWMQLLRDAVPNLARAAILMDPAMGPSLLQGAQAAASAMQVQVFKLEARGPADFERAFDSAAAHKAQALLAFSSPVYNSARKLIAELSARHKLPAIMPFPGFADDGGLMGYGPSLTTMFRQAGGVMAKILKGTPAGEIPIERPTRFELAVNLKTARTLGLKVPQSIMALADRVVE